MIIDVYNPQDNLVNSLNSVDNIVACGDGRYLITTANKCECCSQDVRLTTQVPVNYRIEIKPEHGDKIMVTNL